VTFIPVVLFNQFKFFFNLFFLLICLSQFIPPLKVGFMFTYVSPLAFVLTVTLMKEAWDDF
jgi:phospholipid-translocating ATPase